MEDMMRTSQKASFHRDSFASMINLE